jgi:nucleotide-binding universal stress UspA family protein
LPFTNLQSSVINQQTMDFFGKVAVASTFSPRFLPMLAEARAVAALLERPLEIIHSGPETPEDQERFSEAFAEMRFSGPIHWRQAGQPSDAIIQAVRDAGIGLLLAGAMERDSQGRYFLGKVARALLLEAPCSLLLFANPGRDPAPFRILAVVVDYTPASREALLATLDLAARTQAESVYVLRVFTVFAQVLAEPGQFVEGNDSNAVAAEEARLDAFVEEFDIAAIPIITRCIEGTTGFAAADFVQSIEADLLIVANQAPSGRAQFPARMEWLENVIPANLLVIRPRGAAAAEPQ